MTDTERITLRMPKPVHDWLRQQSFETRESINSLIVSALEDKMNTKTTSNGKNETTRKIWQRNGQWVGYELVEAIGSDGMTYPTVNGESHHDFVNEQAAREWLGN